MTLIPLQSSSRPTGPASGRPEDKLQPGSTCQRHERPKGGSRLSPGRRCYGRAAVILTLLLLSLTTGCAAKDSSSDEERRGGFYGTVSGGMSHP
jgi:hypothetical protein